MREILFRGKCLDEGQWVMGTPWQSVNGNGRVYMRCTAEIDGRTVIVDAAVDPSTIGQYTGLTDKNGKKIFEDDLCRMKIGSFAPEASLMRIVIRNACVGFEPVHPEKVCEEDKDWEPFYKSDEGTMWNIDYFEVVGNIHENPELLEG